MFAFRRLKQACLLLVFTLNLPNSISYTSTLTFVSETLFKQFYNFAVIHERPYLTNSSELRLRYEIFKENAIRAEELNKVYNQSSLPVYGLNKFADFSPEEFRATYLSGLTTPHASHRMQNDFVHSRSDTDLRRLSLPQTVDWREKGVLSAVKDQKTCGACWSFSVVETVESMTAIQLNGSVPSLSVQQVIDCDSGNNGCMGGDICEACEWIKQNGVVADSEYPFTTHTDQCRKMPDTVPRVHTKSYKCRSLVGQEEMLLQILADHGPVAVAVDASTWHNYIGGIIQYHCSDHINHAVQIVGYNLSGEVPYYIVRNSWGKDFGDNGFLYIQYGKNLCGLTFKVASIDMRT